VCALIKHAGTFDFNQRDVSACVEHSSRLLTLAAAGFSPRGAMTSTFSDCTSSVTEAQQSNSSSTTDDEVTSSCISNAVLVNDQQQQPMQRDEPDIAR